MENDGRTLTCAASQAALGEGVITISLYREHPWRRYLLSLLFVFATSLWASGSEFYAVTEADKRFLSEVVKAVTSKDTIWLSEHMNYPLLVTTDKGKQVIIGKQEFAGLLKRKLTDQVIAQIEADSRKPLFKNWQGAMVGDGVLWFTEYQSGSPSEFKFIILAIGYFASQPESWAAPGSRANEAQSFDSKINRTSGATRSRR